MTVSYNAERSLDFIFVPFFVFLYPSHLGYRSSDIRLLICVASRYVRRNYKCMEVIKTFLIACAFLIVHLKPLYLSRKVDISNCGMGVKSSQILTSKRWRGLSIVKDCPFKFRNLNTGKNIIRRRRTFCHSELRFLGC